MINLATSKPDYKQLCNRVNKNYGEDIFQEVCEQILIMPANRLPDINYFNFWFYRVAYNTMSSRGKLGKLVLKEEVKAEFADLSDNPQQLRESAIKEAEEFMLSLSEFENRIILLYNELGDMKKVQKHTGVSYSSLRFVKEKLKEKAKEINAA